MPEESSDFVRCNALFLLNMQSYIVIGIDDSPNPYFKQEILDLISRSKVFSGGKRHYRIVSDFLPEKHQWIEITVPLSKVFDAYDKVFESTSEPIVVFASGDPIFFGFATTIQRERPEAEIKLYPSFNSLQTLAHRLSMQYDDMKTVSLTGRPWHGFDKALIERSHKMGVLTDKVHTPSAIAQRMLDYGYDYYDMYVGEHLGNPDREKVTKISLEDAVKKEFTHPNNLILVVPKEKRDRLYRRFGIPDNEFELLDGRAKMITKSQIRLLSLQALELPRKKTFWDVGFCTGSVSVEAKLQFPHLVIHSFEIREEGRALLDMNTKRFGTPGIEGHIGDFLLEDISELPAPDAVFIGGHGGKLVEIVAKLAEKLLPGGCIVFNAVSDKSRDSFLEAVMKSSLHQEPSIHIVLNDYNPIEIMKAVKAE